MEKNEILVREIIDIDSTYVDYEQAENTSSETVNQEDQNKKSEKKLNTKDKEKDKDKENDGEKQEFEEEDEFNVPLARMEEEIKPQIISTIENLCKNYSKLIKYQKEQLDCALSAKKLSQAKAKGFKNAANITLGLPFIRTSVDHGTALDLAGTGKIDLGSFYCALSFFEKISKNGPHA